MFCKVIGEIVVPWGDDSISKRIVRIVDRSRLLEYVGHALVRNAVCRWIGTAVFASGVVRMQ
jgi:hypothetical protein